MLTDADTDWMLALLTAPGQSQVGRIVRVANVEAPVAPLLKVKHSTAGIFLNLADGQ
jgi:hypothetical protein